MHIRSGTTRPAWVSSSCSILPFNNTSSHSLYWQEKSFLWCEFMLVIDLLLQFSVVCQMHHICTFWCSIFLYPVWSIFSQNLPDSIDSSTFHMRLCSISLGCKMLLSMSWFRSVYRHDYTKKGNITVATTPQKYAAVACHARVYCQNRLSCI